MKKLYTLVLLAVSLIANAQNGPTIDLKYLPVAGTGATEVWNSHMRVLPTAGPNQVWNYYLAFDSVKTHNQPHTINTFYQNRLPNFAKNIDTAIVNNANLYIQTNPLLARALTPTHAAFLTIPNSNGGTLFDDIADSSVQFLRIDTNGVFLVGAYAAKAKYDTVLRYQKPELMIPPSASYSSAVVRDSSHYTIDKRNSNPLLNVHIDGYMIKTFTPHGYGTLIMPNELGTGPITYNNVLVAKVITHRVHNISLGGGAPTVDDMDKCEYFFLRNNPFGTAYLMWLGSAVNGTIANNAYYVNPYKTGKIGGVVYTDISESTTVTSGEAYLYRDSSNFKKNDILLKAPLNANGEYLFDSIPYGHYRVAIRPDTLLYPNAFITYYSDSTSWTQALDINTVNLQGNSLGNKIHLQYQDITGGTNSVEGSFVSNYYENARVIGGTNGTLATNKPVAGVGIKICKRPGGSSARMAVTNSQGTFNITNLTNGDYFLIVDMPGLPSDTCEFTVSGYSKGSGVVFTVDSSKVNNNACATIVTSTSNKNANSINTVKVNPNPFNATTTLYYNIAQDAKVELSITNMLGQRIAYIPQGTQAQGEHSVTLNTLALGLTNGIYTVHITTQQGTQRVKIVQQ